MAAGLSLAKSAVVCLVTDRSESSTLTPGRAYNKRNRRHMIQRVRIFVSSPDDFARMPNDEPYPSGAARYIENADRILVVQIDHETGRPLEGSYYS